MAEHARFEWEVAGQGWGARALEWAYLLEPYSLPANELIFDKLGVGAGTRCLDVACGSGFAAAVAARRGAMVSGLDAAGSLIDIARARTPDGDFRVGDMFDLPFESDAFDAVSSFNGIWKGCEGALDEVARVLTPRGRFGMTYWGAHERLGLLPYFAKIVELSPPSHQAATMEQGDTSRAVDDMLAAKGFRVVERGTVNVVNEWPDVATGVRALAAAGPARPAIDAVGYDAFCEALTGVVADAHDPVLGVRITSEFGWLTAAPAGR
ncbi:MAG: class I SAM-dependent methyltransferase [Acidimicrobiia bacterium]